MTPKMDFEAKMTSYVELMKKTSLSGDLENTEEVIMKLANKYPTFYPFIVNVVSDDLDSKLNVALRTHLGCVYDRNIPVDRPETTVAPKETTPRPGITDVPVTTGTDCKVQQVTQIQVFQIRYSHVF